MAKLKEYAVDYKLRINGEPFDWRDATETAYVEAASEKAAVEKVKDSFKMVQVEIKGSKEVPRSRID